MRVTKRISAWVTAVLVTTGSTVVSAPAVPAFAATAPAASSASCSEADLGSDKRLGPQKLPSAGPVGDIVRGYQPLAGYTVPRFLATYWDTTANNGQGGWRYPPASGYRLVSGQPDQFPLTLNPGLRIDRFGSEYGAFLAPAGTSYAERALPPQSLDSAAAPAGCNYSVYKVVKAFETQVGPIAPGFGQPGGGLQYQLDTALLAAGATANVKWLVDNGYLVREN